MKGWIGGYPKTQGCEHGTHGPKRAFVVLSCPWCLYQGQGHVTSAFSYGFDRSSTVLHDPCGTHQQLAGRLMFFLYELAQFMSLVLVHVFC